MVLKQPTGTGYLMALNIEMAVCFPKQIFSDNHPCAYKYGSQCHRVNLLSY